MAEFEGSINMNSTAVTNALYSNFFVKKNKIKWSGTLEDLKAFVLLEIDENTAETTNWRSPSGGTWCFDNDLLSVTWHKTSGNIYFKGEKGDAVTERIHAFLTTSEEPSESAELVKAIENIFIDGVIDGADDDTNASEESASPAVPTLEKVLKRNDVDEAEKDLGNQHYESEEIISHIETEVNSSSNSKSTYLHTISSNLHTTTKPCNPSGSINTSYSSDSEIGILKSKIENFADNVTAKLADLTCELNSIKENKPYSIVVLENVIDELKKEKLDLNKANDELRKQNTSMRHTITELSLSNKNLEQEKASLLTALYLVQNDYKQSSIKVANTKGELSWHIVNNYKTNRNQTKSEHNPKTDLSAEETPVNGNVINCNTANRYEILSDSELQAADENKELKFDQAGSELEDPNTKKRRIRKDRKTTSKQTGDTPQGADASIQSTNTKVNRKKTVIIAGDSIVKNIIGPKVTNADSDHFFVVKPFPGATTTDMKDFVKPLARKKHDQLILHAGTNDLKYSTPDAVADSIVDLIGQIKEDSPSTRVGVSALLVRADNHILAMKVEKVNNALRIYCNENDVPFMGNANINTSHLNSKGLHLNNLGSTILQQNMSEFASNIS